MSQNSTPPISRRTALKHLSAIVCSVPVSVMALASLADARKKIAKAKAGYQDGPMGDQKCSGCYHFMSPNSCDAVEGAVSPSGWCKLFKPMS